LNYCNFYSALVLLFALDLFFFVPIGRWLFSDIDEENAPALSRSRLLFGAWALAIVASAFTPALPKLAALIFLWGLFRWLFIDQRWKSVRRGCGAPGFMSHWAVRYLALFELFRLIDPSARIGAALWEAYRVDFGLIMVCAGCYKVLSGYTRDEGMEYGRVNPMWGHHWRFFSKKNPFGFYPKLMNCVACIVEIISGFFILSPNSALQTMGALAITLSFFYVSCFIRLGRLAFLMAILPFLIWPGVRAGAVEPQAALCITPWMASCIISSIYAYIFALPVLKAIQYYNYLSQKSLPGGLQKLFDRFMNWVPIIIWRVFTADLVNFYVRIFAVGPTFSDGRMTVLDESTYDLRQKGPILLKLRFLHVCESITLSSLFTTLKYFNGNWGLFEKKLSSYSRSIIGAMNLRDQGQVCQLHYEYVSIVKKENSMFAYPHVATFIWDRKTNKVILEKIDVDFDPSALSRHSPIKQAAAPGTYLSSSR